MQPGAKIKILPNPCWAIIYENSGLVSFFSLRLVFMVDLTVKFNKIRLLECFISVIS